MWEHESGDARGKCQAVVALYLAHAHQARDSSFQKIKTKIKIKISLSINSGRHPSLTASRELLHNHHHHHHSIFGFRFHFHSPQTQKRWGRSCTFREANAVTKLDPSSGRSSATSTVWIPLGGTTEMVHLIFSWRGSMSTTMRLLVEGTFPGLFSWILSLGLWTVSDRDRMGRSFALIISFLVSPVPATIGPRVIILRGRSWLMRFSMLFARRLRIVIACKVICFCLTLLVWAIFVLVFFMCDWSLHSAWLLGNRGLKGKRVGNSVSVMLIPNFHFFF